MQSRMRLLRFWPLLVFSCGFLFLSSLATTTRAQEVHTIIGCDPPKVNTCSPSEATLEPELARIQVRIDGEPNESNWLLLEGEKGTNHRLFTIVPDDSPTGFFFGLADLTEGGVWPFTLVASNTIEFRGAWACRFPEGIGWSQYTDWYTPSPEKALVELVYIPPDPLPPEPGETWTSKDDFTAVWNLPLQTGAVSYYMILKPLVVPQDGIIMYLASDVSLLPVDEGGWGQYDKAAMLVQLSDDGQFRVSDGMEYRADRVLPYSREATYVLEVKANVPDRTYSVFVDGVAIATNYAFRASAEDIGQVCLQGWPAGATGNFEVREHRVVQ